MLKPVSSVDLECVQFELECSTNLLCAVHTAMTSGDAEPSSFLDGLYGLLCYQQSLTDKLRELYTTEDDCQSFGVKGGGSSHGK